MVLTILSVNFLKVTTIFKVIFRQPMMEAKVNIFLRA